MSRIFGVIYIFPLFGLMCLLLQSCCSQSCSRQEYHLFKDRSELRNKRDCQLYSTSTDGAMCGTYCNKQTTCYNFEFLNQEALCLLCIDIRTAVTEFVHVAQSIGNRGEIFEKDDIDDCESSPCMHGGTCTDEVFNHTCACVTGTGGHYCEIDTVNDCASNPCQPCAECVDMLLRYECVCEVGFTGAACTTEIDECASNPCPAATTCIDRINGYACQGSQNPGNIPGIDCADLYKKGVNQSGVYMIQPTNVSQPVKVYCDMETDGGGWIVFQRRGKFVTSFKQNFTTYKSGFGDIFNDFWLGNDNLAMLTAGPTEYVLKVHIANIECKTAYAEYDNFHVSDVTQQYTLSLGAYRGNAGDSFKFHDNTKFHTLDYGKIYCSNRFGNGGFWYHDCATVALNAEPATMRWYQWTVTPRTKKNSTMMFRPMNFP